MITRRGSLRPHSTQTFLRVILPFKKSHFTMVTSFALLFSQKGPVGQLWALFSILKKILFFFGPLLGPCLCILSSSSLWNMAYFLFLGSCPNPSLGVFLGFPSHWAFGYELQKLSTIIRIVTWRNYNFYYST